MNPDCSGDLQWVALVAGLHAACGVLETNTDVGTSCTVQMGLPVALAAGERL